MLSRRNAADVRSGRPKHYITNIAGIKTDWLSGVRNVQIKRQIAVEDAEPCENEKAEVAAFNSIVSRKIAH